MNIEYENLEKSIKETIRKELREEKDMKELEKEYKHNGERILYNNESHMIKELTKAEAEYTKHKLIVEKAKAIKTLNIDWQEVNEERREMGLEIIKNIPMKEAYLTIEFAEEEEKLRKLEMKYKAHKYVYETVVSRLE